MVRIWEQGLVATFSIPGYRELVLEHYRETAAPDTVIEIHGLRDRTSGAAEVIAGRAVNYLGLYQQQEADIAQRIVRAERAGFDAAIIGVMQDPGLELARSLCDMPVIGYGETSMHTACMLGEQFSWIAINPPMTTVLGRLIRAQGYGHRAGPTSIMDCGYPALTNAVAGDPDEFLTAFLAAARRAVAAGSDVLLPGQTIIAELLWRAGIHEVDGALVLDPRPYLVSLAETQARLWRKGRPVRPSTGFLYARPDDELVAALAEYRLTSLSEDER